MNDKQPSEHPPMPIEAFPYIPEGKELFVIGDIHGCADELHELISKLPLTPEARLVFVGDYIDRGPNSRDVLDTLLKLEERYEVYPLMGNHESSLIEFLDQPASAYAARFLLNGGGATLQSYSQRPGAFDLPDEHVDFIRRLKVGYQTQKHFFVHAGLPDVAIEGLAEPSHRDDMLWIRREFFHSNFRWEKLVIHGHTPVEEVEFFPHRINIDTGCVFDNKLTALSLPHKILYQVPRGERTEHLYLKDAPDSKRKAVRFQGTVRVTMVWEGQDIPFETVNYNDFGLLVRELEQRSEPHYVLNDLVNGRIVTEGEDHQFSGRIVRVEVDDSGCRYAVEFDEPLAVEGNGS